MAPGFILNAHEMCEFPSGRALPREIVATSAHNPSLERIEFPMTDVSALFSPLTVKNKTLPNRIVMPPMVVNRGVDTPEGCQWYGERAEAGIGLVIVEATPVPRFETDLTAQTLRPLVDAIHQGGALAAIQLYPGALGQATKPADMSQADIEQLLGYYVSAAQICADAGFDGIEPHGAHGYLLNQFFSRVRNRRTDGYGGTLEGRMKLGLDIVERIRPISEQVGMLVLYRHTPVAKGYEMAESLEFAARLVEAGVDILDISPASAEAPGDLAAPFMELGVPVIAVNQLDRIERAMEVLREKRADLVAVGRGLIADFEWPRKVREGRLDEITVCQNCNQCFDDLRRGGPRGL